MSSYLSRLCRIENGAHWARFHIYFFHSSSIYVFECDIFWQVRENYSWTQKQLKKSLILRLFSVNRQVCGLCELWYAKHFSWVQSWSLNFPSYCTSHHSNASSTLIRVFWFIFTYFNFFFIYCCVGLACVDCSASSDTVNVLKQVVDLGCCIVLANKKPLTSTIVIHTYVFKK